MCIFYIGGVFVGEVIEKVYVFYGGIFFYSKKVCGCKVFLKYGEIVFLIFEFFWVKIKNFVEFLVLEFLVFILLYIFLG